MSTAPETEDDTALAASAPRQDARLEHLANPELDDRQFLSEVGALLTDVVDGEAMWIVLFTADGNCSIKGDADYLNRLIDSGGGQALPQALAEVAEHQQVKVIEVGAVAAGSSKSSAGQTLQPGRRALRLRRSAAWPKGSSEEPSAETPKHGPTSPVTTEEESETVSPAAAPPKNLLLVPLFLTGHTAVVCLLVRPMPPTLRKLMSEYLLALALVGKLRSANLRAMQQQRQSMQLQAQLEQTQEMAQNAEKALQLGDAISFSVEKEKTGFALANELKTYLEVDRITILEKYGSKVFVVAVSGQPTFDRRSNVIRSTERLVRKLLPRGEATWFEGEVNELAPAIQEPLVQYLEQSLAQSFALIPIKESKPPVYSSEVETLVEIVSPGQTHADIVRGAILIESISVPIDREVVERRWKPVEQQVGNHFTNAKKYSDLFLMPAVLVLNKFFAFYQGHTKRIAIAITVAVATLLTLGIVVQSEFRVRCEGYLQPAEQQPIFVAQNGIIRDVLVQDGDKVTEGQVLIRAVNQDLRARATEIEGELETKKAELKAITNQRLRAFQRSPQEGAGDDRENLTRESNLLRAQISSLQEQHQIVEEQLTKLEIKAPFSGTILGWNIPRKFGNRPVQEGTILFYVAKVNGDHKLELKVPDKRSGYVQTAYQKYTDKGEDLDLEFSIGSFPDRTYYGKVTNVRPNLEQDSDLGYVLPIDAEPVEELPEELQLRAGESVVAKIICGHRSFLYCKTYEFLDWMNQTLFKYFG